MDLNKDNRDIYTIDSESYSEYMKEKVSEPRDLLSFIIQILIVILLFVLVYLFFNILKNDLTFSEVFNKKELLSAYESLVDSDDEIHVVMDNESEKVPEKMSSKKIVIISEKKPLEKVAVTEKKQPVIKEIEKTKESKEVEVVTLTVVKKEKPMVKKPKVEEVIVQEKEIVVKEHFKPVAIIKVETKPVEVIKKKKIEDESELTENYLDRMVAELNSEI